MKYKVTLNGKTYEVEVEAGKAILLDEYEALAPAPAAAAAPVAAVPAAPSAPAAPAVSLAAGETVESPMPGNILSVNVKQGDTVKAGQVLAILEAMKMENEIVAPCDGIVKAVLVKANDAVDSDQELVIM